MVQTKLNSDRIKNRMVGNNNNNTIIIHVIISLSQLY